MASEIIDELRRGSGSLRKGTGGRMSLVFPIDYLVVTNDKRTTREEVLLATTNAPIVGLPYGPVGATCVGKNCERDEINPLYWTLTCEFDTGSEEQQQDPQQPNNPDPTTWISLWRIEINDDQEETLYEDFTATPLAYVNTAGEIYEPLTTVRKSVPSWKFNQFEPSSLTMQQISERHMHVNSTAIRGFPAYSLLLSIKDCDLGVFNGVYCWNVSYSVSYKKGASDGAGGFYGWRDVRYSAGYNYLDAGVLKPYRVNGVQVFGPLTSAGARALTGGLPDWDLAHKQVFKPYPEINFNSFIRSVP